MNNKGSILVVTLGFIVIATLLGFAAINHAGQQNFMAERLKFSTQAFWLADAGTEKAKTRLQQSSPQSISRYDTNYPAPLGDGKYDVYSEPDRSCVDSSNSACINMMPRNESCFGKTTAGETAYQSFMSTSCYVNCPDRWVVCSKGESNPDTTNPINPTENQKRKIQAVVAKYDIKNALTTHGTVNDGTTPATCQGQGGAVIAGGCLPKEEFTFESIFNGTSLTDVINLSTPVMNPPNNIVVNPGVTTYYLTGNNNGLSLNTTNVGYPNASFLVVDTTGVNVNKQPVTLTFAGGAEFCGIVWIIGEGKFVGTANVKGAIFVDGQPIEDTKVSGTNDIIFHPPCIQNALSSLGSTYDDTPGLISWKEKDF
jgi:hypothetical protein